MIGVMINPPKHGSPEPAGKKANSAADKKEAKQAEDPFTLANYERIRMGMTESEVEGIMGSPGREQSSSSFGQGTQFAVDTKLVAWTKWGRSVTVTFQNGKATLKAQFGLK
jgi:hypothetical protein